MEASKGRTSKILLGLLLTILLIIVGGGAYWFGSRSVKVSPSPVSILEPGTSPTSASSVTEAVTGTTSPTALATATPIATTTPIPTPSSTSAGFISRLFGPSLSILLTPNFTANYQARFTCSSMQALSFRIVNTGTLDLESWQMRTEGPVGIVLNDYTNMNNHFRHVATNCASPGYSKMAPEETAWIYMSIPTVPTAGTSGKSTIKMCTKEDLAGSCKEVIVNFTF